MTEYEENSYPSKGRYRGLCSTCNNVSSCTYLGSSERAVMFCEEFDASSSSPTSRVKPPLSTPITYIDLSCAEEDSSAYKGLCKFCEIRDTCTYPKSETGVWHCEEYE